MWSEGLTKRHGNHSDKTSNVLLEPPVCGLFFIARASPAVITLPANRSPCFTFLSLILSMGAEKNGGLNKNASRKTPVFAVFFPASIAIAAPREWPANQTPELPKVATTWRTACIAISKREVWWSPFLMMWISISRSRVTASPLVIVPRKAITWRGASPWEGVGVSWNMAPKMQESASSMRGLYSLNWKDSHQGEARAWFSFRFSWRSLSRMYTLWTKQAAIDLRWLGFVLHTEYRYKNYKYSLPSVKETQK